MTKRIKKLTELTLKGEMHVVPRNVDFSQYDKSLPSYVNEDVSRLCEYIVKQEPVINEYCSFTGRFNFDGSVIGDAFKRGGHANNHKGYNDGNGFFDRSFGYSAPKKGGGVFISDRGIRRAKQNGKRYGFDSSRRAYGRAADYHKDQ
jgi:aspartyl/asparaginyl beta-hydroxylase (cupin superfamily)